MVCPQCESVRNFDDFNFEFSLPVHYVDIRTPAKYRAQSVLEETALKIDGDLYEIDGIKDLPVKEVRRIIGELQGTDELESAATELPSNHPHEYNAPPYLSRHLSTDRGEDLEELADKIGITPQLALLIAYAESKNSELGKSSGELEYYIQSRDQLAELLGDEDDVTDRIEMEFVSFLLLSMALVESLSYEILFKELYREEHRHETNRKRVYKLSHGRCLQRIYNNEIIDKDFKNKIIREKEVRNNIAHDLSTRTELQSCRSVPWIRRRMESIDRVLTSLLDLRSITGPRVIAEHGPESYIQDKLHREGGAIDNAIDHWKAEHKGRFETLVALDRINFEALRWKIKVGSSQKRNVKNGVDFEGLPTNLDSATKAQKEFYESLMKFIRCCEDRLLREIERDMDVVNLDRREFMLATLLIRGKQEAENTDSETNNRYKWICGRLQTTPKFVQRKENVLAWRAGSEVRDRLGDVPEPSHPVRPF